MCDERARARDVRVHPSVNADRARARQTEQLCVMDARILAGVAGLYRTGLTAFEACAKFRRGIARARNMRVKMYAKRLISSLRSSQNLMRI